MVFLHFLALSFTFAYFLFIQIHDAIAREESQEFEEGIVTEEFRRGFILEDQLLRPAMVKVSSGRGEKQPSSVADTLEEQPASAGVDEREFSEQSTE